MKNLACQELMEGARMKYGQIPTSTPRIWESHDKLSLSDSNQPTTNLNMDEPKIGTALASTLCPTIFIMPIPGPVGYRKIPDMYVSVF